MKLNWKEVCEALHVPYVTQGPSVVRNHIAIKCPFCGNADPSTHMGLSLDRSRPYWGCWRNPHHRGRSPLRLLAQLVGNETRARDILRQFGRFHPEDGYKTSTLPTPQHKSLDVWRRDFIPLRPERYGSFPFLAYLRRRGFEPAERVATRYRLHYTVTGEYSWRIIIPAHAEGETIVAFTSRSILPSDRLRYKASGSSLKHYLMNEAMLRQQGKILVLTEGPFDYMKLDFYGRSLNEAKGIRVTCGFGVDLTRAQKGTLGYLLRTYYDRGVIAFDPGAERQAMVLADELAEVSGKEVNVVTDTGEAEDIGAMTFDQVLDFVRAL